MNEQESLPRFYYFANWMLRHVVYPATRLGVTVRGVENVPLTGPLLIVSNHLSNIDPTLVGVLVPRDVVMMSKSENFERGGLSEWVVRNYGAFPVRRGEGDVGAIRQSLRVLKEGRALYIAPEGTRSRDGQLQEPQEGVALLAVRSGAPLLPVGLVGQEKFIHHIRRWRATPVQVAIGRPFRLVSPTPKPDREQLEALSVAIMERIAAEVPPAYRGRFQPAPPNPLVEVL